MEEVPSIEELYGDGKITRQEYKEYKRLTRNMYRLKKLQAKRQAKIIRIKTKETIWIRILKAITPVSLWGGKK